MFELDMFSFVLGYFSLGGFLIFCWIMECLQSSTQEATEK